MSNRSRIVARLAAVCVSLLIAFIAVEGIARVTGVDLPLVWRPHPRMGWWHIPGAKMEWTEEGHGHVQINSLGMRDVERSVAKPPKVFRIGIFGDSMTEGVQVDLEQTYARLLEGRL